MQSAARLLKTLATALLISAVIIILVGTILLLFSKNTKLPSFMPTLSNLLTKKTSPVPPTDQPVQDAPQNTCLERDALKQAKECSLLIGDVEKHGTGFVNQSGNYLITNYHVIDNYETGYANVFYEGRFHSSRIAGLSLENDLAVIRLNDRLPGCRWADSRDLDLAENVFAIGWPSSPYGESTITKGIFSRYVYLKDDGVPMIQTDTPINPGNSGGPLINKCGVVGINTSKVTWIDQNAPSEGIGYAISSDYARGIIEELMAEDDGSPKIPTEKINPESPAVEGASDQNQTEAEKEHLNPGSFVAYNYDQVLFWEDRKLYDQAVLNSWKKAKKSDFVDQNKLDDLLEKQERSLEIAQILWDGYTNSKVTYAQVLELKQEYLFLSKEISLLTSQLNIEGSISAYNNCIESWEKLEGEHQEKYTEQKKECEKIIDPEEN